MPWFWWLICIVFQVVFTGGAIESYIILKKARKYHKEESYAVKYRRDDFGGSLLWFAGITAINLIQLMWWAGWLTP